MNSAHERVLRYFRDKHLPLTQQCVSEMFHNLAYHMAEKFQGDGIDGAEVTVGLRKLLEAKDCFVRVSLML